MTAPLLIFIVVLGLAVRKLDQQTDEIVRQTRLVAAADGPSASLTSLQDERHWAVVELIGQGGPVTVRVEGYTETRHRTDTALAAFQHLLGDGDEQTRRTYAPAIDGLAARLDELRQRIDSNTNERNLLNLEFGNEIFDAYSLLLQPFFAGTTRIAQAIDRSDLRQGAELIDASARQVETIGYLVRTSIITSLFTEGGINQLADRAAAVPSGRGRPGPTRRCDRALRQGLGPHRARTMLVLALVGVVVDDIVTDYGLTSDRLATPRARALGRTDDTRRRRRCFDSVPKHWVRASVCRSDLDGVAVEIRQVGVVDSRCVFAATKHLPTRRSHSLNGGIDALGGSVGEVEAEVLPPALLADTGSFLISRCEIKARESPPSGVPRNTIGPSRNCSSMPNTSR